MRGEVVAESALREGQVLTGPLFSEPMRVVTVRANATLVGLRSEQFRQVALTSADILATIQRPASCA